MRWPIAMSLVCLAVPCTAASAGPWTVERTDAGVTIKLDGQQVSEYQTRSGAKPILWPLVGPTGKQHTRAYPMLEVAGEQHDHPHQRSCWLTHGSVNGIDFWSELPGHGTIEHREFGDVTGGDAAVIVTRNDWIGPDGRKQLEDERRVTFRSGEGTRIFDFDATLRATNGPVVFGDTKEGSFGVRVATSISIDGKQGGRIVNSDGATDKDAWGKRASWVDYQGPVDGERVGIAILNHPASFRYPTFWHVRPYGLFAANPFGEHDFTTAGDGTFTLPAGDSLALHYRVILHAGDDKQAKLADAFSAYEKESR